MRFNGLDAVLVFGARCRAILRPVNPFYIAIYTAAKGMTARRLEPVSLCLTVSEPRCIFKIFALGGGRASTAHSTDQFAR